MAFDAGKIEASLDLDRSPFQRSLDEAKRQGRDFESQRYASKVDADTTEATAKIIDIRDRLERISAKKVTPTIDLEGFAEAEVRIKLLQEQLDKLNRSRIGPSVGGAGGGSGGSSSSGGFFRPSGMLAAGVFAGPMAVPLAVGGAGLAASFLTPTVAGAAGLGLFGAASKSAIERVSKEQKQLAALDQRIANTSPTNATSAASSAQIAAAQGRLQAANARLAAVQASDTSTPASISAARASVLSAQSSLAGLQARGGTSGNPEYEKLLKQRQQLLSTMTPAERAAAKGVQELDDAWKHFQRALEPQTFRLLATGTDIFRKGLHDLLPMTKAVGDTVDNLAKRADTALSQPFWRNFFGEFLTREAPRAVNTLGTVLGNVITGFAHLTEDFAPLGHRLEDDVVRWSGIFDKWTQGSGPQKFVALVEQDGPIAAQALEALAKGLGGLAAGLEPIGRIELQALTPVLNFIGELGRQHPEVITALGVAYLAVAGGLKAIDAVNSVQKTLEKVSLGMTGLRRGALLTAGAIGVFEIGKHAGGAGSATLGGALAGLAVGMLAFGPEGAAVGAVVGGFAALGTHLVTATGEAKNLTDQVDALAGSLEAAIKLDKGLLGKNVRGQVKQTLLTNPDFQKPGIGGLTFLQTLTKYGVTEKQIIDYASGRGESRSINDVIGAARTSGNKQFLDQFTELMESIIQAIGEFKDIRQFGGRGGRHGHRGSAARHPASEQHGGTTNYYDLRGSTFQGVQHAHQLQHSLQQKQRVAALSQGPGERRIGFDR